MANSNQFRLKTEDDARTFLIFIWAIPYKVDTMIDTVRVILQPISDSILIIIKGINFWGIDIHRNKFHSNLDRILTNHIWIGAIPILEINNNMIIISKFIDDSGLNKTNKKRTAEAFTWNVKYLIAIILVSFPGENNIIPTNDIRFNSIINQVDIIDLEDRENIILIILIIKDKISKYHEISLVECLIKGLSW